MSSTTASLPAANRVGSRIVSSSPEARVYAATRRFVPPRSTPTEKELIRSQVSNKWTPIIRRGCRPNIGKRMPGLNIDRNRNELRIPYPTTTLCNIHEKVGSGNDSILYDSDSFDRCVRKETGGSKKLVSTR